jgi:hypothetical protein
MANMRKVSLALDPTVVEDLDYVGGRLGVSRSAMVNQLLLEAVPVMRKLLQQVPLSPTPTDAVRFRGESAKIVEERLAELQGIAHDLFSK